MPTTNRVVFITVDDGIDRNIRWVQLMRSGRWPVVMFPTGEMTDASPAYWRGMLAAGVPCRTIPTRTPTLDGARPTSRPLQICAGRARSTRQPGPNRPSSVRPTAHGTPAPLQAARQCRMRYVVVGHCRGYGRITYARGYLRPGSIMLLHLTPNFQTDLTVALEAAQRAGLRPAYPTNYLR